MIKEKSKEINDSQFIYFNPAKFFEMMNLCELI